MKSITVIAFLFATISGSYGLKCKSDSACLTETQMGGGWGGFFKDAANAPCLKMSWSKGDDDLVSDFEEMVSDKS